ncbi:glycerate kinase [Longispora albida]|uniref:glycerate kinase family protein n=1 Tax=Longispora albida TaxID=203523 RepID=UPI00036B9F06|nr:glycerate kinase [Longispora albida]
MRVVVCPDKFAGSLSAPEVAAAIAAGWASVSPGDELVCRPLADGGPGFLAVLGGLGGSVLDVGSVDPLGRPVGAQVLLVGETAYVESAQVCGLHLLAEGERDPKVTSSFGLGVLVRAAVAAGAREVVVGLGGSGTNDCGAGMLAALGAPPVDAAGEVLPPGGAALSRCAGLGGAVDLGGARLVAATDVDSPLLGLHGASNVYGPQKGASRSDVLLLDAALGAYRGVLNKAFGSDLDLPGAGAAGGIGAAIFALGGRRVAGFGLVRELTGLDAAIDGASLVITGEGSFDAQSLRGKVVSGVAEAAAEQGAPCVVIAGVSTVGRREAAAAGVTEIYSLAEHFGDAGRALSEAADGLRALGARAAGQWSR